MSWFRWLRRKKAARSNKNGEKLTEWEDSFLCTQERCPDCKKGRLLAGPCGGLSQNIKCDNCGSRFNFIHPFTTERISDPCPDKPEAREDLLPGHNAMSEYR